MRACPGQTASCVACVHCTHEPDARKYAREPCTQRKSSRTCICHALAQKLREVIHKVEAAIVGPFMRGESFSLADVAAAPFFQVSFRVWVLGFARVRVCTCTGGRESERERAKERER